MALVVGDALVLTTAVVLALWTWSLTAGFAFNVEFLRARVAWFITIPVWLLALAPTRRYEAVLDVAESARGLVRVAGLLLTVYLFAFFLFRGATLPRLVALYLLWDATLLLLGWRMVAQWLLTRAEFARRVVVVGDGAALDASLAMLRTPAFREIQILGTAESGSDAITGLERALDAAATDVVIASSNDLDVTGVKHLLSCQAQGVHVLRMAQLYEDTLQRVPVEHVETSWLLTNFFDVGSFRQQSPIAKRAFDLAVGVVLAAAGLVLAPFIVAAIALDSRGPVLYSQRRVGLGGREFMLTKFRTMRTDAEKDGAARWSPPGDSRVTRVGKFLRRTRLDELPNVIAILRGDMSVVGPRPERPEFVTQLEQEVPLYRARLIVRPGLTGWAQVNVPYGDSVNDASVKLEYDLYYIKHQSIWFDAAIVWRTVGTIFKLAGR